MLEGTAGHDAELKQQGVIDAARDPNTAIDAEQAEQALLNQSRAAGAAAFTFDPDATAEEKARQVKERNEAVGRPHRKHVTAALVSDQDDGQTAGYDLPEPSKQGALPVPGSGDADVVDEKQAKEEEFSRVGWAPRFGNPADNDEEGTLLDHQDFIEGKLSDKLFGDWYHNTGVIIFACLTSWTVAVLGGGLGWVFIVMAVCGTYYRTSLRRVRRNFRDDVQREMAKNRLETDHESLEWINSFLVKFWPIYAPVLCNTIVSSVDQVLSTSTPPFLDSMRMKFFTLGTKPPRLEHVKTYPKAEDDTVLMDWKFSFTPNDVADLTSRQIKNKVNPKVVLEIRVGKAMISKGLDIIVEDMACSGIMRVKMKLQLPFPHIDRVEICFLERPVFDYACKPIGGETFGFDINFMPGLESFISEQIHANLAPMMYAPNVFPIEVAKMLSGNPVDQAIGVLSLTFHGAQGLKNPDKFSGTPDPYATVSVNNRDVLGKTKTVPENASPRWNETVNIVLTSLREPLTIHVYDYNEYRKDKELGVCTFNLEQLETETDHENLHLEVIAGGRPRGLVQCDIRFFPVLEGQKSADGTIEPPPESSTGIAKFEVEQAKDLDGTKSLIGQLNPYAVLLLNGKEVQISKKLKRTNNPIWADASKELLITDRKKAKLGLVLKDDRDLAADPVIGTYQIKLDDMLELMNKGQEWYNLAGVKSGRAKMRLQWKPVALKGAIGGSGGYVTPIGVMRIHFMSGKDLKNLDTVGKSDPYARVNLSGIQKRRTPTWKNNLNPEWDEIFYVPMHTPREKITLEVMDEESVGSDRTMGKVDLAASDYIEQGEDGEYLVHDTKDEVLARQLRIGNNSPKGTIYFTAAFYPTIPTVDPEDEDDEDVKSKASMDGVRQSIESNGRVGRERSNTAGTVSTAHSSATRNGEREMQKALAAGEKEQVEADEVREKVVPKMRITEENITQYESGILIFKIVEGEFSQNHQNCHLEVVLDDHLFPQYSSAKTRSRHHVFNETSDATIRELDLSQITLRLVSEIDHAGKDGEKYVEAKLTGNMLEALKRGLNTPTQYTLKGTHNGGGESKITVNLRYIPLRMQLDPSESFNNSGNLRVEVLDAADLPAADRNGFSDPYCKFRLGDEQLYKTKIQKKTLHPAWNEFFETPIRSRTAAKFKVDVYDWDFGEKADYLGGADIDLNVLEPFQAQEVTLPLDGKSGAIRLKMVFKPSYVTRSRQGSSTFSGTFSVPGKVVGAPVKGVGKGAVFVGGNVVKGASFLTRGFKRRTASHTVSDEGNGAIAELRDTSMDVGDTPTSPNGKISVDGSAPRDSTASHNRQRSMGASSQAPAGESGTASITVISASGFEDDTKLEVRIMHETSKGASQIIRTKTIKAKSGEAVWGEEDVKRLPCAASDWFKVVVKENKTFGHDDLGEASFFLDDQGTGGAPKEIKIGDKGGVVVLRASFQAADAGSVATGSAPPGSSSGPPAAAATPSLEVPHSPKGKGGLGRFVSKRDRSVTPSTAPAN
ncbi:hypothetical protein Q7P37_004274 [Cladosporium fusiforme]